MKHQGNWWNVLVVLAALGVALTGCAAFNKNYVTDVEGLLTKAGFKKMVADTPKKLAYLKSLPQHKLTRRSRDGKVYVVYADATYCTCLYVGNETNLSNYRDLEIEQNVNPLRLLDQPDIVTGEDFSTLWGPSN